MNDFIMDHFSAGGLFTCILLFVFMIIFLWKYLKHRGRSKQRHHQIIGLNEIIRNQQLKAEKPRQKIALRKPYFRKGTPHSHVYMRNDGHGFASLTADGFEDVDIYDLMREAYIDYLEVQAHEEIFDAYFKNHPMARQHYLDFMNKLDDDCDVLADAHEVHSDGPKAEENKQMIEDIVQTEAPTEVETKSHASDVSDSDSSESSKSISDSVSNSE